MEKLLGNLLYHVSTDEGLMILKKCREQAARDRREHEALTSFLKGLVGNITGLLKAYSVGE